MYCHRCGREIEDESLFCLYCGTKMPIENDIDISNMDDDNSVENYNDEASNDTSPEIQPTKIKQFLTENQFVRTGSMCDLDTAEVNTIEQNYNAQHKAHITNNLTKIILFGSIAILIIALLLLYKLQCSNPDALCDNQSKIVEISGIKSTPASYENEIERWDAENCIYSNFKYGVAFDLPKGMVWQKISGTSKHTVVKFVQPESEVVLFVNILPISENAKTSDIWNVYDVYVNAMYTTIPKYVKENSAETVEKINARKAVICGNHAIKMRYESIVGDDRYNEKRRYIAIDYSFVHNKDIMTLSLKGKADVFEQFINEGIQIEDFLRSFQLVRKYE